ncbi:MAG: Nif3-like dinuclear metal center hexameric protein [Kiritimatiellae bacterium]|nr:Nif3-like dinuclear metal center hexameric protein [Kiritimatiellia bacterium]
MTRRLGLTRITDWLDRTLRVADFDDVSNNGLQIARSRPDVCRAAVAVDASVRAVEAAARVGADLLVVHHGISWGGGIRRLEGGVYGVVRAAMAADVAVYACHLPLDAHATLGNNAQLAKLLGLRRVRPAFRYHGNVIGLVGESPRARTVEIGGRGHDIPRGLVGVCSGGAGEFAEEAKRLGCALYVTGEASWGDVVAAENCGMRMVCAGHYATEVFGVRAVAAAMRRSLRLQVGDLTAELA